VCDNIYRAIKRPTFNNDKFNKTA